MCALILNLVVKLHYDNFSGTDLYLNHLNNKLNPNMNNLMSLDHANRDWIDDTDYLVPRVAAEYPRLAENYAKKNDVKPWGNRDPVYTEPYLDEN